MTDDLVYRPAVEQARLVHGGEISSAELVAAYLDRIDRLDPSLGAYLTVAADHARDAATDADRWLSDGGERPPFLGVPVSVKDLTSTAGIRTTYGCAANADHVPDHDDEVVTRLRAAGFVILGKTVTPELGPMNVSEPPGYPPGRNPWDTERSCGGSSGGAAAAAIAGLAPVCHGSDGGGSIRNPSSWCGALGVKPSRGRISDAPRPQQFFSVQGPIGRCVDDVAALLDVLAGPAPGDTFWAPPPDRPFLEQSRDDVPRLRVGWTDRPAEDGIEVAASNREAVSEAARLFDSLGHEVSEVDFPTTGDDLLGPMATVMSAGYAARVPELPPLDTLTTWTRSLIEIGGTFSGADVLAAQSSLQTASRGVVDRFSRDHDVLLTPTVAAPPPLVGQYAEIDMSRVQELWALTPFTGLWNTTGQPAVSIPWTFDGEGLPVGVQVVGPPTGEGLLLAIARQVERARPWADRRPPVG